MLHLTLTTFFLLTLFSIPSSALPGGSWRGLQHGTPKAVYFQTNKAPNSIVALPIARDGTISAGTLIPTGGDGGNTVDAMTHAPN